MSDKVRDEFEVWAISSGYNIKMVAQPAAEYCLQISIYANGQTRSAWQAWQASRQALVVDLNSNRKFFSKAEIFQKLSDAGIKCK